MNVLTYVPLGVATPVVDLVNISIANAGIVALLGYGVVFFGLILLMCVITLLGKAFMAAEAKQKAAAAAAPAAAAPAAAAPVVNAEPAPGSAGKLKLHDVEPKTAAMLMAIVADKMGKPINELRFISIKEVK
jgi:Na+-transporting methylmalonyl-CoA/oxaloacetate decarboxylase gamma subunit